MSTAHKLINTADVKALLNEYVDALKAADNSEAASEISLRTEGAAWAFWRLELLSTDELEHFTSRVREAVAQLAERGV